MHTGGQRIPIHSGTGVPSSADKRLSRREPQLHVLAGGAHQNQILGEEYGVSADGAGARPSTKDRRSVLLEQGDHVRAQSVQQSTLGRSVRRVAHYQRTDLLQVDFREGQLLVREKARG